MMIKIVLAVTLVLQAEVQMDRKMAARVFVLEVGLVLKSEAWKIHLLKGSRKQMPMLEEPEVVATVVLS